MMTSTTEPNMPSVIPATPLIVGGLPPAPERPANPSGGGLPAGTVPALPLIAGGVPKPPQDAPGADSDIVLHFPTDEVIGTVVILKQGETASYCPAQGEVRVPAGWSVQLNLVNGITDASVLAGFDPYVIRVLTGTGLDDAGVRPLASLTGLVYLSLGTEIGDEGLAAVARVSSLTSLSVQSPRVTDAGAAHIATLPDLVTVNLSPSGITDDGLRLLAGMPGLRTLSVRSDRLTNGAVAACSGSTTLESLSLQGAGIDDRALPALAEGFVTLKDAHIDGPGVTNEGVMAAFARGLQAQLNGQWYSPKAVERLARRASGN